MTAHTRLPRWGILLILALLPSACLLTLGSPLVRRVEPGRWTVEAGGGLTNGGDPGFVAHVYAGRALGKHFEIGLMPYGYSFDGEASGALYVPLKWDPFPLQWPVRLVVHAGPIAFSGLVNGVAAAAGLGVAGEIGKYIEVAASGGVVIPAVQLPSFSAGVRVNPTERFSVGLSVLAAVPGPMGLEVSASVLLPR